MLHRAYGIFAARKLAPTCMARPTGYGARRGTDWVVKRIRFGGTHGGCPTILPPSPAPPLH